MANHSDFDNGWGVNWTEGFIPWHRNYVQPCLEQHYEKLLPKDRAPPSKPRIFVPLCGKTIDMIWLAKKGFQVVGLEAVETAIIEFFKENNVAYDVKTTDPDGIKCYSSLGKSKDISIYQMDVFKVTPGILGGTFDAIWDRGSLSAIDLHVGDRGRRYADRLLALLYPGGCIMIENHVYPEDPGKNCLPTHVPESLLRCLFGKTFDITQLEVDLSNVPPLEPHYTFYREYFLMVAKR